MNRITCLILAVLITATFSEVQASTGASAQSGSWTSASTWLFAGVSRVPTCGDTVTISSMDTVTVNSQVSLSACSSWLFIIVDSGAVFQFTNGNKLDLPCNSTVQLLAGAELKKATAGGGNSTLISICGTTDWNASDGDIWGPVTYGGTTLPVLWLEVSVIASDKDVTVSWSTASEINNNYFTIEKTSDGVQFSAVGMVEGAGNSTVTHNYQFIDPSPYKGISYYRVKQTDFDGKNSYSALLPVDFENKAASILLFPNPASNSIYVSLPEFNSGDNTYTLQVFDILGKEVMSPVEVIGRLNSDRSNNLITLDITSLSGGIYTARLISEAGMQQSRFIKQQ